ncbi:MAG: ATP synthase F1 subunit gamma [Terriglobales bacterium]
MPNLLDIRRRIRSVRNTRQITRAMQMVSAAKLRRAHEQALAARPYAERLAALLAMTAGADVDPGDAGQAAALLAQRPEERVTLVVISGDKGLAGAFNANVFKAAHQAAAERRERGARVEYEAVGRKARDHCRRRRLPLCGETTGLFGRQVDYAVAREIAARLMRRYAAGETDAVYTIGNEFQSVLRQRVTLRRLLPVAAAPAGAPGAGPRKPAAGEPPAAAANEPIEPVFEPSAAAVLAALLPRYIETQVYRSLLESFAAEHAARMNAMDTATKNAADMIDSLSLSMNRVRQAAITKEIIEVVSGAAAQAG